VNDRSRLLARIRKLDDSGCWIWQGQVGNSGYGKVMLRDADGNTRMDSVHRASYSAFIGPLAAGQVVVQRCGNRLCINPEHLELLDGPP